MGRHSNTDDSIFLSSCHCFLSSFQACLALGKKHMNINEIDSEGANCLTWCADVYRMSACLQLGADVTRSWKEDGEVVNAFTYTMTNPLIWTIEEEEIAINQSMLLLSVGIDPLDKVISGKFKRVVKPQVELWLAGIEAAKPCFEDIFDNEVLESLVLSFVFSEAFLRKALQNCK